jgi:hypothetical protein
MRLGRLIVSIFTLLHGCNEATKIESRGGNGQFEMAGVFWYDSTNSDRSIFFDFERMRHGETSKANRSPTSHFGGPVIGCSTSNVGCVHGGVTLSFPREIGIRSWGIVDYTCHLKGTEGTGTVSCQTANQDRRFAYEIEGGRIVKFGLTIEGYPPNDLVYSSRGEGIPIAMIRNYELR